MKCVALVCVAVSLLAGCATTSKYHPTQNGDFYVGGSGSVAEQPPIANSIRSVREAQITDSGRVLRDTIKTSIVKAHSFHLLLGYQVTQVFDLEATLHTNAVSSLRFSSLHNVDDQSIEGPPSSGIHAVRIKGELQESGAMLTALANWRFQENFRAFARFGGSYDQTTLQSELSRELGPDQFISEVKYRTADIQPVWGVGIIVSDVARLEYLTRKIPLSPAATISDGETLHSLLITLRFGLRNFFGGGE